MLLTLPFAITGLSLAIGSRKKNHNGFNKSELILNGVSLIIFAINVILVILW